MRVSRHAYISITLAIAALAAAVFASISSAAQKHPIEVTGSPICSACHPDKWPGMDHTSDWTATHKFRAAQGQQVCVLCHAETFCIDCHASKEEIKPSDKYKDRPSMELPHRGDYLTRHTIDGKVNPAACFRCHGRGNNARCKACHR